MRILAIFVILCAIFCTSCGSKSTNTEADVAASVKSGYDAGIAAYKRGHYQVALYDLDPRAVGGDPIAQFCVGYMYKNGLGVAANHEKAKEWYTNAAEQGYPAAQNNLGVMYVRRYEESGGNDPKILETAAKWFQRAAEQGNLSAQHNLGVILSGQIRLKWWTQAAAQGYAPSQLELGNLYYRGDGVDQDFTEAKRWYSKAAKQKYPLAQMNLGTCYFEGNGVEEDPKEGVRWFKEAAEQGHAGGQFKLALAYYSGKGVDKNEDKAIRWFTRAAEQGYLDAISNLGAIYGEKAGEMYALSTKGTGPVRSLEIAKVWSEMSNRWYLLAAQQGQSIAQSNLGEQFEQGQEHYQWMGKNHLTKDAFEAYYWYSLALKDKAALKRSLSKAPVFEVTEALDRVEKSLKDAGKEKRINQIQEQVEKWQPKQLEGTGTGFYVDKNHILTNAHVVTWKTPRGDIQVYNEFRIPYRRVTLKEVDLVNDLALLYDERGNENTDENGSPIAAKFRSKPIEFGEKISLFGYPQSPSLSYAGNLTSGIVSGLSYQIDSNLRPEDGFQHTAPTQRGNSGGPVFDAHGNVIGVCVRGFIDFQLFVTPVLGMGIDIPQTIDRAQNINFAIKSEVVDRFLEENSISPVISWVSLAKIHEGLEELKRRNTTGESLPKEPLKEIPLGTIKTEAERFTRPILAFKEKADPPLSVEEITIDELKE